MKRYNVSRVDIEGDTHQQEMLRTEDMSVDVMRFTPEDTDHMHAHEVQEVYHIASGSAAINVEGDVTPVTAGDVIHIEPGEKHRFQDFDSALVVTVFYAPPNKRH